MITVNTRPTLEGYKFFFRRGKFRSIMLVFDIFIIAVMVVMALITLFYYISYGKYFSTLVLYIVIIAVDTPLISGTLHAYKTAYDKTIKDHPDLTHRLVFNAGGFIAADETAGHSSEITYKFSSVKKARYGKGWFAVYLPGNKGYVFNIKDINGDPDALKIMLRNGLGRKFKESR